MYKLFEAEIKWLEEKEMKKLKILEELEKIERINFMDIIVTIN